MEGLTLIYSVLSINRSIMDKPDHMACIVKDRYSSYSHGYIKSIGCKDQEVADVTEKQSFQVKDVWLAQLEADLWLLTRDYFISLRDLIKNLNEVMRPDFMKRAVEEAARTDDGEKAVDLALKYELLENPDLADNRKRVGLFNLRHIITELMASPWKTKD